MGCIMLSLDLVPDGKYHWKPSKNSEYLPNIATATFASEMLCVRNWEGSWFLSQPLQYDVSSLW